MEALCYAQSELQISLIFMIKVLEDTKTKEYIFFAAPIENVAQVNVAWS